MPDTQIRALSKNNSFSSLIALKRNSTTNNASNQYEGLKNELGIFRKDQI